MAKRKPNIPNIILTLISIIFLLVLVFKFNYKVTDDVLPYEKTLNSTETKEQISEEIQKQPNITIKIASVGDIMCHNTQYIDAYDKTTDTYDFMHMFTNVADDLRKADLTIGNLETTFAGKERGYSGYPNFNTPEKLATNLKELGFDVLSTANNHSLDTGYKGIEGTIANLDNVGISHMGTYTSEEMGQEILVKDVKGIKIAFLSYTYGTNGIPIPKGKEYCVNLIDKNKIKQDIEKAKECGVDLISVSMHWGEEYRLKPTAEQKELADFLFEQGVDIILGSHAHVLEPMETREITLYDGTKKQVFLIYSQGNFISAQTKQYTNHSIILNLTITKHSEGNITIDKVEYIPTYVNMRNTTSAKRFKILNIDKSILAYENKTDSSITENLYENLKKAREATEKILNNEI